MSVGQIKLLLWLITEQVVCNLQYTKQRDFPCFLATAPLIRK